MKPTQQWICLYRAACLLLVLTLSLGTGVAVAENIDPSDTGSQYAWGENTGWLNAEPGGDGGPGVSVEDDGVRGYLWSETTGWVSVSCLTNSTCGTRDYGVTNDGAGNLAGYAWSENAGWISFSCTNDADNCATKNYGVTIDPTNGQFSGRAWSENTGWISFRNMNGGVSYGVTTSWRGDLDGDGVDDDIDLCPGTASSDPVDANGCSDAQVDSDGDSLCNPSAPSAGPSTCTGDEGVLGTNPNDPDTDNDGLFDGTEVDSAMGTGCPDPLNPDSDGDTLLDGNEVTATPSTNPCDADTDGDGLTDDMDPTPTVPGVPPEFLEQAALDLADTIRALDLSLFNGPNANANKGRRNALANRAMEAADAIAAGDIQGAIEELTSLLTKIDGQSPPPDWMTDSPERTALADEVGSLIALLVLEL